MPAEPPTCPKRATPWFGPGAAPGFVGRLASGWPARGVGESAARIAVALVFVVGLFATASATQVEGESDLSVQGGEDCETIEQVNVHATSIHRRPNAASGPPARDIAGPYAPRSLIPRWAEPPRPTWLRPRRTDPPDDDDDDELA